MGKLTVTFKANSGNAIYLEAKTVGLIAYDQYCAAVGYVPALAFDFEVGSISTDAYVDLSIEQARASGRFAETSSVTVEVPRHSLNDFVREVPHVPTASGNPCMVRRLDSQTILAAWAAAGYPLKWESPAPASDDFDMTAFK